MPFLINTLLYDRCAGVHCSKREMAIPMLRMVDLENNKDKSKIEWINII
jgi:hypothetical protein